MVENGNTVKAADEALTDLHTDEEIAAEIQAGINTDENLLELWNRSQFISKHFIKRLVGSMCQEDANYEDYMQQCFLAVMVAAKKYKPKGAAFQSVLVYYIKLYLCSYNGSSMSCVRIPDSMKRIVRKYKIFADQYKNENCGKEPSREVTIKALKLRKHDYHALMTAIANAKTASVDAYINDDGDTLSEILASDEKLENAVCYSVYLKELHDALKDALAIVPEKTKLMIISVYYNGASIDQVAESFGVSRLTVRNNIRNGFDRILLDGKTRRRLESFMPYGYTYDIDKLIEKKNKTRDYNRTLYRESKAINNMTN